MLAPPRGMAQRIAASAFQAECRGFETRLPLQIPFRAWGDTQPFPRAAREGCSEGATALS
jgi:hypothetical protein